MKKIRLIFLLTLVVFFGALTQNSFAHYNYYPAQGNVDILTNGRVAGWAKDPDNTGKPIVVQVTNKAGTIQYGITTASKYRSDVGYHAFDMGKLNIPSDSTEVYVRAFGIDRYGNQEGGYTVIGFRGWQQFGNAIDYKLVTYPYPVIHIEQAIDVWRYYSTYYKQWRYDYRRVWARGYNKTNPDEILRVDINSRVDMVIKSLNNVYISKYIYDKGWHLVTSDIGYNRPMSENNEFETIMFLEKYYENVGVKQYL